MSAADTNEPFRYADAFRGHSSLSERISFAPEASPNRSAPVSFSSVQGIDTRREFGEEEPCNCRTL